MEKFTVYKVQPIEGWNSRCYRLTTFKEMQACLNELLYKQIKSVKVTAIFAHQSRFLPLREALISLFEITNQATWKYGDPVEIERSGATLEQLEEVSHFADGVPREFYDKYPLWD